MKYSQGKFAFHIETRQSRDLRIPNAFFLTNSVPQTHKNIEKTLIFCDIL